MTGLGDNLQLGVGHWNGRNLVKRMGVKMAYGPQEHRVGRDKEGTITRENKATGAKKSPMPHQGAGSPLPWG